MSAQRSVLDRIHGALFARRRRWVTGGIGALAVSGLVLCGLAGPASADDLPNSVAVEQSAGAGANWTGSALADNETPPADDQTSPAVDENPVVTSDATVTSDNNTDDAPDRCASSRTKVHCGDNDNTEVTPQVEGTDVTTTTTTAAPALDPVNTVAGGGDPGSPAPEMVLPAVEEQPAPAADPAPAATLPRTGASSHLGTEVSLAFGLLGAGIALLLFRRRRPVAEGQQG